MKPEPDESQSKRPPERGVDEVDRKLLGVLVQDATTTYAELGRRVGLSPAAVHERVKRLRHSGVIRRVAALIDPDALGKALLAFVHVDTTIWGKTQALLAVEEHPEVEEIHSVAGDTCMLLKVRTDSPRSLEGLLNRIYDAPGVTATRSYVVLSTYLERPVQPGITAKWPAPAISDAPA